MSLLRTSPVRVTGRMFLLIALLFATSAVADKQFQMPRADNARSYPAHDEHPTEKITIAADPYDMPDKAKIFTINYLDQGLLPVFLVISNDGDNPISILDLKLQLTTRDRAKANAATEDDIYRRLTSTRKIQEDASGARRLPIPIPTKPKKPVPKNLRDELDAAMFHAKAVEPHTTHAGFVFFDIGDLNNPMAGARLYITGVKDGMGNDLMYFEIPMEKYLTGGK